MLKNILWVILYVFLYNSPLLSQAFSQDTVFMRVKIIDIVQNTEISDETGSASDTQSLSDNSQNTQNSDEQTQEIDPFAPDLSDLPPDEIQENDKTEGQSIIQIKTHEITVTQFTVKILDGPFKGDTRTIVFKGSDTMPEYAKYKKGDTVFAGFNKIGMENNTEEYFSLYDIDNSTGLIVALVFLFIVVLIIGKLKGLMAILSIVPTAVLVFIGFIPLVLNGFPSLPAAIIVCVLSTTVTIPLITGFSKKSLAAILGASTGVILSALIALIFGELMHLAGIITDDMITVFYLSNIHLNLKDLALSGMIIAALGAIIDVAISLASATSEIFNANPELGKKKAFKSVTTVGTDILGATVNTLILAYIGSSLSLILLVSLKFDKQMPLMMIFSYNPVLVEIIKSIVGSAGMFLSIPATAYIAVQLYFSKIKSRQGTSNNYHPQ